MIGKTISHYKILEKLGEGGMGVVYKAEDTKLKRTVALKFLPSELTRDKDAKERFFVEAQAAAALEHQNICSIYEIDEAEDQIFIAMSCIEGQNLKEKIESGPLQIDEALKIATQIAEGLQEAHDKGIVHRDIKSANIMITDRGQVKIMDFGLAKLKGKSKLTKVGTTVGTAAYMSPEQAQGKKVDHKTDIWSLGVVLYEMITGRLPFKGDYEQAVVYSILNEEPEPATALRTGVPQELERIINKALVKDPSARYQHADDMMVDLRKLKKDSKPEVTATRKKTNPEIHLKASRKVIILGSIIMAGLIVVGGYFIFKGKATEKPATISTTELSDKRWENSVAVLPFRDFSLNKDQESFCDGMTDAIIGKLSQIRQLKIISLTSVLQYKGQGLNIKKIGKELDVETILEGSIQKEDNKLRINAQLINVADDSHLWQNTYNRELESLFAIQDDISQAIVNSLKIELLEDERDLLKTHHTQSTEAYNLYSQGRFYWRKRTEEGFKKSIKFYEDALKLDPDYAVAYSGLADTYSVMAWNRYLPQKEGYAKAKKAALKALELNDRLAEAHNSLAYLMLDYEWNFEGAKQEFERAIQLNPGFADARLWYARYFVYMGNFEKAILLAKQALELDPIAPYYIYSLAGINLWAEKYDEAETLLKRGIAMHPDFALNHNLLGIIYLEKSMYEKAMAEFEVFETPLKLEFWKLIIEARRGNTKKLEAFLEKFLWGKVTHKISQTEIAFAYAIAGNTDKVFEWLGRAYEARDPWVLYSKVFPEIKKYHYDKRFKNLVKKIGLE